MSRPRLSLCLIVRDEESNLDQCLRSVAEHVDEIICVDTGSVDRTKEVATRFGASVYQFDHVSHPASFFLDTKEENAKWGGPGEYSGMWCLSDFGAARQESFRRATGDYIVWIDADDVMKGAEHLRTVVQHLEATQQPMAFLSYDYAVDHLGRVFYRQWRERIIKRGTASWQNHVHEVLMPNTPPTSLPARYETPVYSHRRKADRKQVPHRNYKILLRQVWQIKTANPAASIDPRILFYLGQEARYVEPMKAIGFYEEYLQKSGWSEERAAAHMALGHIIEGGPLPLSPEQRWAAAQKEFAVAAAEMPNNPDGLFGLARMAHMRQRWFDCIRYSEAAFAIGNTDTMLGTNPMDRLYKPHVFYNFALSNVGRVEDALKSCKAALEVMPDDPGIPGGASGMLTCNAKAYENHLAVIKEQELKKMQQQPPAPDLGRPVAMMNLLEDLDTPPHPGIVPDALMIWATQLWKQIIASGDEARARRMLEALPSQLLTHPHIEKLRQATDRKFTKAQITFQGKVLEPYVQPAAGYDVVLYLGAGPEPWDPNTPASKGIGGSETAAIEMAKNLAALGHRCVVYAEALGTFDGVEYRHHSTFRGAVCDIFISSRAPWAIETFGQVTSKLALLWVHDIHCGPRSADMERWLYRFDRILCLSEWHKGFFMSCYPTLHADRVIVTRNGIDPSRFGAVVPKTNSLVFSSSPNRGLSELLHNFRGYIKPQVPDAELHVFYGFDTWEQIARRNNSHAELAEIEKFRAMLPPLGGNEGGIFNHGKRPQHEVAAAYMRAKVWPYMTGFPETSCITAMESMAAGCVPVYSALAALPETVGVRGVALDNNDPQVGNKLVANVVELLRDESKRAPLAALGRQHALANLSWQDIAKQWSAMFDTFIAEVQTNPIAPWRAA